MSTPELDYQESKNNSIVHNDIKFLKKVPKYDVDCNDHKFINLTKERDLFQNCVLADDLTELGAKKLDFQLKPELSSFYSELQPKNNVVVVFPTFTLSAYSEPGFYTF
jgi:hypothetical protein